MISPKPWEVIEGDSGKFHIYSGHERVCTCSKEEDAHIIVDLRNQLTV